MHEEDLPTEAEDAFKVFFSLDADKFERFVALLDAPAAPNAGLQRLLAVRASWVAEACGPK